MLAASLPILQCIPPDNTAESHYDFEEILAFFLFGGESLSYEAVSALSISNTDYWGVPHWSEQNHLFLIFAEVNIRTQYVLTWDMSKLLIWGGDPVVRYPFYPPFDCASSVN